MRHASPADIKELNRIAKLKPKQADVRSIPGATVTDTPDGKYTVDLNGKQQIGALREMLRPALDAKLAWNHRVNAAIPHARVRTPSGDIKSVPVACEADVARQGCRPVLTGRRRRIDPATEPAPERLPCGHVERRTIMGTCPWGCE